MARLADFIEASIDTIVAQCDTSTNREQLIDIIDYECDELFTERTNRTKNLALYNLDDLLDTSQVCGYIIKFAEERAWVEDDDGLWDGLVYGVLASVAYFSLRNCIVQLMQDRGIDVNDDFPFED
jgi:hypothetical protein